MEPGRGCANNSPRADKAYTAIRRAILRCELAPGEQVTESRLAERYEFGRAAVRAALARLRQEQLVDVTPRHGYTVAPVTFKHVHDLFGVRLVIEPAVARLAATASDDQIIAELEELNRRCAHTRSDDDIATLRQANKAFHVAVARATGNERLAEIAGVVLDEMDRILYLPIVANVWDRIDATFEEHQHIVEAVRRRDAAAAEDAAGDHVVLNKQFVLDALTASPVLRTINLVGV